MRIQPFLPTPNSALTPSAQESLGKSIGDAVKQLNQLCEKKEALYASCAPYKEAKEAREKTKAAYASFSKMNLTRANSILAESKLTPSAVERILLCGPHTSPSLFELWKPVLEGIETPTEERKNALIDATAHALMTSRTTFNSLAFSLTHLTTPTGAGHAVLQGCMQKALERASQVENKQWRYNQRLAFIKEVENYQTLRAKYRTEEAYKAYSEDKKAAYKALNALASQCTLEEVKSHPKMTNEAIQLLTRLSS